MGRLRMRDVLGNHFKGPIIPFGSLSRIHQFGKTVLLGLFRGYALYVGGIWKGDVLIADLEELETMDASEIYSKRLNAKQVIFSQENENSFSSRRWTNQTSWRRSGTDNIHPWYGNVQFEGENHVDFLGDSDRSLPPPHDSFPDAGEAMDDFGLCQETPYTAITLNQESKFTRREKNRSLFHWSTLTFPELHIETWMLCQNAASTTTGTSMGQETCLILGQVWLSLLY